MLKKTLIIMLGLICNFSSNLSSVKPETSGMLCGAGCGIATYLLQTGPRKSLIATIIAGTLFNEKALDAIKSQDKKDNFMKYFKAWNKEPITSAICAGISEHLVSNILFFADKFGRKQKPSVVVYRKEKSKKSSDDDDNE